MPKLPTHNALAALQYPPFRTYILSRFFFILVINMQATILSWTVYDITKDPFSTGLIGLMEFGPAFAMAFFSGHVIDRGDKRDLLLYSMVGNLVVTATLTFITSTYSALHFSDLLRLGALYSMSFFTGILRAFSGPTSFALVSHLVPKDKLPSAITWHSGTWQVAAVSGPALGGLLYGWIGITPTFFLMLSGLLIAVFAAFFLPAQPPIAPAREETVAQSIRQGFRFVWRTREVLGALSLDLFAVFFGGATALLPYVSDVILQAGPKGLGILRSAPALGGVAVMLLLTLRPLKRAQGRAMLWCVAAFGLCMIAFGLSHSFWFSFLVLFLSGLVDGISVIVRSTVLQMKTPDEMRGRVASLNSIFIMSSNELGAFESGFTAKLMGVVPAIIFGGCMTLVVTVVTWFKAPTLRDLEY